MKLDVDRENPFFQGILLSNVVIPGTVVTPHILEMSVRLILSFRSFHPQICPWNIEHQWPEFNWIIEILPPYDANFLCCFVLASLMFRLLCSIAVMVLSPNRRLPTLLGLGRNPRPTSKTNTSPKHLKPASKRRLNPKPKVCWSYLSPVPAKWFLDLEMRLFWSATEMSELKLMIWLIS